MSSFPRGSEWRKWDLHVHVPNTALNNGYREEGKDDLFDTFANVIESSDVFVIGVTDYFSLDNSLACIRRFRELHPDSEKLLLPNMEVRLVDVVNAGGEEVHAHLIFRNDLSTERAHEFMASLKTTRTDNGRQLSVKDVAARGLHDSVVVSRSAIDEAFNATFGPESPRESMLVVVPCRGDGIRPKRGVRRKNVQAAEVDKWSDAVFGGATDRAFFLDPDRATEEDLNLVPKPVFAGSDSHSFEDLRSRLGRVTAGDRASEITWVKADPTFDGLLQTLIEPDERVRIQPMRPDLKEPYQVIRSVRFTGSDDFPAEIPLNANLVSVIGSRSSGKSALLAYVAHAIDPVGTVDAQVAVGVETEGTAGPAAGIPWAEVADVHCEVLWADEGGGSGQVIYIPQNSLFALSTRPEDITAKIRPVLYRQSPDVEVLHQRLTQEFSALNADIRANTGTWFELERAVREESDRRRSLGDKVAVDSAIATLVALVAELRENANLSQEDSSEYEALMARISSREIEARQMDTDLAKLEPWIETVGGQRTASGSIAANITTTPRTHDLPARVREALEPVLRANEAEVRDKLQSAIAAEADRLAAAIGALRVADERDRTENAALVEKNAANEALQEALERLARQKAVFAEIESSDLELGRLTDEQAATASEIARLVAARQSELDAFVGRFKDLAPALDDMQFGVEVGATAAAVDAASRALDFRQTSDFVDPDDQHLVLERVRTRSAEFLRDLASVSLRLKTGHNVEGFAAEALALTEEVRFLATLQGDRIGGFETSTMTPGKQALFALTLILNESNHRWPLLIDQPEDDLDSRSIYDSIVPYLKERKRERQIIMVSHNANLVVGADSEQVIVANRHGDDRPNRDGRTFQYLSGSLEQSHRDDTATFVLEACGIREHTCALLDGGEEAFRKRRDKYRMGR